MVQDGSSACYHRESVHTVSTAIAHCITRRPIILSTGTALIRRTRFARLATPSAIRSIRLMQFLRSPCFPVPQRSSLILASTTTPSGTHLLVSRLALFHSHNRIIRSLTSRLFEVAHRSRLVMGRCTWTRPAATTTSTRTLGCCRGNVTFVAALHLQSEPS
jgi:hypothetical protein